MSTTDQPSSVNPQNHARNPIFHPQNHAQDPIFHPQNHAQDPIFHPQNHAQIPIFHSQTPRNWNIPVGFQPFITPRILEKNQEACNLFKMGKCRYGGNCKYQHIVQQRPRTEIHEMGQLYEGRRMGNRGVEYCKWTFERCPYKKRCHFVHKGQDNRERSIDGIVLRGQTNRDAVRKTKLCYKWEEFGSCPFGEACYYTHGKEELRRSGSGSNLHSVPNAFAANLLSTLPRNHQSRRTGFNSFGLEKKRKKSLFNWDVEKMSRIYADWIDLAPAY